MTLTLIHNGTLIDGNGGKPVADGALLIDGSPSCGSGFIHDGGFGGRRHAGAGVTAALLRQNGIEVFAETQIDALRARLSPEA